MLGCRLCLTDTKSSLQHDEWNVPLFETDNFVVLPSLGALVEGWVLIVPKHHYICAGAIPEFLYSEMEHLKSSVSNLLRSAYGDVVMFEHGPHKPSCDVGCGVDHAHLHVVPVSTDLVAKGLKYLPPGADWKAASVEDCRRAFLEKSSYIFLEDQEGSSFIATSDNFGSQLLRKAIAADLKLDGQFNWREFPQLDHVKATIETIRNLGGLALCRNPTKRAA